VPAKEIVGDGSSVSGMTETVAALPEAIVGSLSPSRASDFKTCPLLYRFRTIDRLPEAPSRAATRGTVVHAVLEGLFDLPASERTLEAAQQLVGPAWQHLLDDAPELAGLFADDERGRLRAVRLAGFGARSGRELLRHRGSDAPGTGGARGARRDHRRRVAAACYVDRLDVTRPVTCGSSTTRPARSRARRSRRRPCSR